MKRLLLLVFVCSCGPFDVVVADVSLADGGAFRRDIPCHDDFQCHMGDHCEKMPCTAPSGFCRPGPPMMCR
jgi:hypothetical protein